jgi:hypothetical protein
VVPGTSLDWNSGWMTTRPLLPNQSGVKPGSAMSQSPRRPASGLDSAKP